MANRFLLTREQHEELWDHLLGGEKEEVAFAFAEAATHEDGVTFRAVEVYRVPPAELSVQLEYHIALTDEAQARIIKMAWDLGLALVELHSHRGGFSPTGFSPSDLSGLDDFVPHVRWRLRGKPYLALVTGSADFDALVWRDLEPEPLHALEVDGHALEPTNETISMLRRLTRRGNDGVSV